MLEPARGQHDHGQVAGAAELLEDREPVARGQREVEHHDVGLRGSDRGERFLGIGRLDRFERHARVLKRASHERSDVGLVIDDEDLHALSAGMRTTNVDPPPGVSS